MKKRIGLILILIFLSFKVYSQEKEIRTDNHSFDITLTPQYHPYKEEHKDKFTERDYYEYTDESNPGKYKLPSYTIILAIPPGTKPQIDAKVIDENISKNVIPALNPFVKLSEKKEPEYVPTTYSTISMQDSHNNLLEVKEYFWLRDFYCVSLKLNTHWFDNKDNSLHEIRKLQINVTLPGNVSIPAYSPIKVISNYDESLRDIILNANIAEPFRSHYNLNKISNIKNWYRNDLQYLKMGVADDGIYRIYKSDLQKYYPNSDFIDITTFQLFCKGVEIPIYFFGGNDGKFGDNDFIEFYGTKNYDSPNYRCVNPKNQPYYEYMNRYSDTTIYWLTWGGDKGLRVDSNKISSGSKTDTLNTYTEINHYESNNYLGSTEPDLVTGENCEWLSNETWIWSQIDVGTYSYNFNVSNVVPNQSAIAYCKVVDYAANIITNAHCSSLKINNYPIVYDSSYFNKYDQRLLTAKFNTNDLFNGTDKLNYISYPTTAFPNSVELDWYEIQYQRYLTPTSNRFKFSFNQNILPALYNVRLANISSDKYVLYKIGPVYKRISNFNSSNGNLVFQDSLKTGDSYFLEDINSILKPNFYYIKQMKDITDKSIQSDYILITHKTFLSTAQDYLNFIKTQYSVNGIIIDVDDIYDQFNYGFFSPVPIRDFLKQAYQNWQSPKPSYVFLVGEANYDYHNYLHKANYSRNFVPAFGHPVSDTWFTIWDTASAIPQMYIGRICVNNINEFQHYFDKHQKSATDSYDIWNKSYILFSGGQTQSDQNFTQSVNIDLIKNLIKPSPIGGFITHFYATTNPVSNFGPYTSSFVDSTIKAGAQVISYVGHSGTKIWDNGIDDVDKLSNDVNKYPLITDFGCSTGKFAEPDIESFSESFTSGLNGDAIGYIGNSSWGFSSTAQTFPKLFYTEILEDNISQLGKAHLLAKIKLLQLGNTSVNKVFVACNSLLADPIVTLKIPPKPNLVIKSNNIILPSRIDDNADSFMVSVKYSNIGKVDTTKFNITINDYLNGILAFSKTIEKQLPNNLDVIKFSLPTKNLGGQHKLEIILDNSNVINELDKNDNTAEVDYMILSSSVKSLLVDEMRTKFNGSILFLNSLRRPKSDSLYIDLSSTNNFTDSKTLRFKFDTLYTKAKLTGLVNNMRYWMRIYHPSNMNEYFETKSFIYDSSEISHYYLGDSTSFSGLENIQTQYGINGETVSRIKKNLVLSSAGFQAGGIAKLEFESVNYAMNTQGCGFHNLIFDAKTMKILDYRWFNYWNDPNNYTEYVKFLNTITDDKILAIAISGNCGGFSLSNSLKDKLKQFGSSQVNKIGWGTSWILLGKLGAAPGSVPEMISTTGSVEFDSTFSLNSSSGKLVTTKIGPASYWKQLKVKHTNSSNSSISFRPLGITLTGQTDSLNIIQVTDSLVDLSSIDAKKYSYLKILSLFNSADDGTSPLLSSLGLDFVGVPELTTNYQVVSVSKDSLMQGDSLKLKFFVYNVGESPADSFNVKIELVKPDNTTKILTNSLVSKIDSMQRKEFTITYKTNYNDGSGNMKFKISIDPDNKIHELFKDNNTFEIPFYVKRDTTPTSITSASVDVKFDGITIVDGDYVSSNPEINFTLSYPVWFPVYDSMAIKFLLDNKQISFSEFDIYSDAINRKAIFKYKPGLKNGEHSLEIYGENITGVLDNKSGYKVAFNVSDELKIMNVFNYPNPFKGNTNFTFTLTQIPDDLKIKIYTVAGRLIKEINSSPYPLHAGYNSIPWDGKDEDGDAIANGTYIYKMIIKKEGKTQNSVHRLTVIR